MKSSIKFLLARIYISIILKEYYKEIIYFKRQYYMQEIDDIIFFASYFFFLSRTRGHEDCDCDRVIGVITMARVFITRSQVV